MGRNCQIDLEVSEQKHLNEIESLRRKLKTTETRLECKARENRQKD